MRRGGRQGVLVVGDAGRRVEVGYRDRAIGAGNDERCARGRNCGQHEAVDRNLCDAVEGRQRERAGDRLAGAGRRGPGRQITLLDTAVGAGDGTVAESGDLEGVIEAVYGDADGRQRRGTAGIGDRVGEGVDGRCPLGEVELTVRIVARRPVGLHGDDRAGGERHRRSGRVGGAIDGGHGEGVVEIEILARRAWRHVERHARALVGRDRVVDRDRRVVDRLDDDRRGRRGRRQAAGIGQREGEDTIARGRTLADVLVGDRLEQLVEHGLVEDAGVGVPDRQREPIGTQLDIEVGPRKAELDVAAGNWQRMAIDQDDLRRSVDKACQTDGQRLDVVLAEVAGIGVDIDDRDRAVALGEGVPVAAATDADRAVRVESEGRRVVDAGDVDGDGCGVGAAVAVGDGVGEGVGAEEVGVRRVGDDAADQRDGAVGRLRHRRDGQRLAGVGCEAVVAEHVQHRGAGVLVDVERIVDGVGIVVDGDHRDRRDVGVGLRDRRAGRARIDAGVAAVVGHHRQCDGAVEIRRREIPGRGPGGQIRVDIGQRTHQGHDGNCAADRDAAPRCS